MRRAPRAGFAVTCEDGAWSRTSLRRACVFEGDDVPFAQIGYTIPVLAPGRPNGLYHRERDQEDFLVLDAARCWRFIEARSDSCGVGLRALPAGTDQSSWARATARA
jgi:hypothetical protein